MSEPTCSDLHCRAFSDAELDRLHGSEVCALAHKRRGCGECDVVWLRRRNIKMREERLKQEARWEAR